MSSSNETSMDSTNINDLRENFNRQQVKITALKELVRKSGVEHDKVTTTTQEKVKSIAQRLTHLKSKARARQQQQQHQNLSIVNEFNDISNNTSNIEDQGQQQYDVQDQEQQHSISLPPRSSSSLLLSLSSNEVITSTTPMVVIPATSSTVSDISTPVTDVSFTSDSTADANNMQRRARSETPSSGKIQLLRQQMEQNKLKIAKRESNKREIEEMVIQLKQRLDTTQQSLEKSSEFSGKSMGDLSTFMKVTGPGMKYNSSASDLNSATVSCGVGGGGFNLDKERIKFLENRIRLLEKQLDKEKEKNQQQQQQTNKPKDQSDDDIEKQQQINQLQNQVIDLQENLKEKDTIIDARTKAISLMTEDFSIKSKSTVDKLEDTRQEMFKMQQLFSETEQNYKIKIDKLLEDLHEKTKQIEILEEDLKKENHMKTITKNEEYTEHKEKRYVSVQTEVTIGDNEKHLKEERANNRSDKSEDDEKQFVSTQTESDVNDDAIKLVTIEYLEKMKDLQNQIDVLQKENDELKEERQLRQSTIIDEDTETDQLVKKLQAQNEQQEEEIQNLITRIRNLEEQLQEKTVECNVLNANFSVLQEKLKSTTMPKLLFPKSQDENFDCEMNKLKSQLDESNRSMIKMKLKIKQLQKEIDSFKKISNVHSEVIRLTEENDVLKQKLIEINEENNQMQLKLKTTTKMANDGSVGGGTAVDESELEKKIQILEATCQNQTSAIQLLEEQKLDMTENLQTTKLELETLKDNLNAREGFNTVDNNVKGDNDDCQRHRHITISSQMEIIKLEEHINDLKSQVLELNETICVQKSEINSLTNDKLELSRKIDHYVAENIELLDKIEKLSKSSSSAESIEIVERLTQQEKQEIEELQQQQQQIKHHHLMSDTMAETEEHSQCHSVATSISGDNGHHEIIKSRKSRGTQKADDKYDAELNENLIKLREESSELQHKIELFTKERHEVLDKMEYLTIENQDHVERIKQLLETKLMLEKNYEDLQKELQATKVECEKLISDKNQMFDEIQEMRSNEKQITEELSKLTKEKDSLKEKNIKEASITLSSTVSPLLDNNLIDICEKSLQRLNNEIENYQKSNDKNNKLTISRKLVKQSKNVYNQMIDLLSKLKDGIYLNSSTISSSTSSPTNLESEVDKNISVYLINRLQEFEKIIENVQSEFDLLRRNSNNKDDQIQQLSNELNNFHDVSKELQQQLIDDKTKYQHELDHLQQIRKELENRLNVSDQEVKILKTLVSEQKQQLIDSYTEHESEINEKLKIIHDYEINIENLKHELNVVRSDKMKSINNYNEKLETTIQQLRNTLRDNEILIAEQSKEIQHKQETIDTLNEQIITLYRNLEENTKQITERDVKIEQIQHSLNKNCNNLTTIAKQNEIYKNKIDELLNELHSNSNKLSQLEKSKNNNELETNNLKERLAEFEKTNANLTERNKELHEKLKKFAVNLKKKQIQCNDLEMKLKEMENNKSIEEQEKQSAEENRKKDDENNEMQIIEKYRSENSEMRSLLNEQIIRIQHLEDEVSLLRNEVIDRDTENQELRGRYEAEIDNIKSEQTECNTLKTMLHKQIEEKQQKIIEMQKQMNEEQDRIRSMQTDISAKDLKLEKCKAVIKEKNKEIKRLTLECENLEKQLQERQQQQQHLQDVQQTSERENEKNADILNSSELKSQLEKLENDYVALQEKHKNETEIFQNTIKRLEQCYDGIQAKLQENLNYIETLEYENTKYKDNVIKLENCLAIIEEKRSTLEISKNLLNKQLENRQIEYEKNEDALVQRLNMLSEHDDHIGRLLLETQEENQELLEKLDNLKIDNHDLMKKFTQIEKDYQQFKQNDYEQLKSDNQFIKQQYDQQQNEILKLQQNFDHQLAKKDAEIDELENELSIQLKQINQEKRSLQENYEKATDENQELKDEICRLKESLNSIEQQKVDLERENTWIKMQNENYVQDQIELQELRKQLIQDKNDIDQLTHQLDTLKLQISELDSIRMQVSQNQTDDQVFIETENKKLKELLSEKDLLIENYQKQNLQLQMAAAAAASTLSSASATYDPFSSIIIDQQQQQQMQISLTSPTDDDQTCNNVNAIYAEKIQKLENDLSQMRAIINEKDEQIRNLLKDNGNLQERFDDLSRNLTELQISSNEKQKENDNLREELKQFKHSSHNGTGNGSGIHEEEMISIFNASNEHQAMVSMTAVSVSTSGAPNAVATNVFSDILTTSVTNSSTAIDGGGAATGFGVHEQKKIEDLERNVSDLEKYANDLEMKLKNLTVLHEETVRNYEEKIVKLEERIVELQMINTVNSLAAAERPLNQNQSLQTGDNQTGHTGEVHEELIVPKKAYICQPSDQVPQSQPPPSLSSQIASIGLGDDDDWAWGSEDAKLELQHFTEKTATSVSADNNNNDGNGNSSIQRYFTVGDDEEKQSLRAKLKEYQQQIDELKFERNRLDEQKIELQIKSGKMMKKLKEYKLKIDQLSSASNSVEVFRKSSSCESNDLDLAIQEELKSQLQITENALQILKDQLRKEIQEKENLSKRCDLLSQSNDRLIELKEKNEVHIMNLQSEINHLNEQIKNLNDWSSNSSTATAMMPAKLLSDTNVDKHDQNIEYLSKDNSINDRVFQQQGNNDNLIASLKRELEDVKCDRDELQALLNEEKQQTKTYENDLRNLQNKIAELEELSENLKKENIERQKLVDATERELKKLKSQFDERKKDIVELERKLKESIEQNGKLQLELNKMNLDRSNYQEELNSMIQYKNDEVEHLKMKIEQIMTEKDANNEIIKLKQNENDELKRNIQMLQKEQEQIKDQQKYLNDLNHPNSTIEDNQQNSLKMQEQIEQIQQLSEQNKSLLNEKQQMEEELRVLNNHVIENLAIEDKMKKIALELDMKNIEISELKNSLDILQKRLDDNNETVAYVDTNSNDNISSSGKNDEIIKELDMKWNEIVEQKCKEIADSWRKHLEIKENEFRKIENDLREQLQEALKVQNINENKIKFHPSSETEETEIETETEAEVDEINKKWGDNVVDSPEEVIKRMQTVLENQEIEIVTLKEQLAIRSAEYARLAAKHDPFGQITSTSSSSGTMSTMATMSTSSNSNQNGNMVPKSELDLAWYMLHQREMRCEELTLELVNLLEERDTLQLKLSNSLRQVEEIKQKMRQGEGNSSGGGCVSIESGSDSDPGINLLDSPIKLSTVQQQTQNLSLDDSKSQDSELDVKLSQLHAVNYSKDKRLHAERDQRQRQMEQIQQDIANIPPEAVSELIGTNTSNVIESPSTVLLNWLWGKSNNQ